MHLMEKAKMSHLKSAALVPLLIMLAAAAAAPARRHAIADIVDGQGQTKGRATLNQDKDGIHVDVRGVGLTAGVHAVHIHMAGTCTGPDFTSAGGHWNPSMKKHGHDNPDGAHMGDMPNMTVVADGTGMLKYTVAGATLDALLDADGAAIVIHAAADDYKSDPTGNAGARLACGVVKAE